MTKVLPFGVIAFALMAGCAPKPVPTIVADAGEAAALSPDEQVLLALEAYSPMYQMNAKGRVIKMKIPWQHLTEPLLAEINKLSALENLDCYATTINDEGLAQLKDLQKLRSLGLGGCEVTDEGLPHLGKLHNLRYVWLSKRKVSEEAAAALKATLPDLTVYWQ